MMVDIDWPVEKKRAIIKRAIELYGIRGTVKGMKLFLLLFTGHEPTIIENQWPFRGFRIDWFRKVCGISVPLYAAADEGHFRWTGHFYRDPVVPANHDNRKNLRPAVDRRGVLRSLGRFYDVSAHI